MIVTSNLIQTHKVVTIDKTGGHGRSKYPALQKNWAKTSHNTHDKLTK
jgi:hypothetical protein